jgi:hypothetical protein
MPTWGIVRAEAEERPGGILVHPHRQRHANHNPNHCEDERLAQDHPEHLRVAGETSLFEAVFAFAPLGTVLPGGVSLALGIGANTAIFSLIHAAR